MKEKITENGKVLTEEEEEEVKKDSEKKIVETRDRGKVVLNKLKG
jgi:hypothetical protein